MVSECTEEIIDWQFPDADFSGFISVLREYSTFPTDQLGSLYIYDLYQVYFKDFFIGI